MAARYEAAGSFSQGLAAVKENGRWGYVDRSGRLAVPAKYTSAGSFSEGLAAVRAGEKYGYIDKSGKEVVRPAYEAAHAFHEGLAAVEKDGKWGFIGKDGTVAAALEYDLVTDMRGSAAIVRRNGQYGILRVKTGSFTDVPAGSDYAQAVEWAVGKGITEGTSPSTFSPDRKCTTAEILMFLWRAMGEPEPAGSVGFADVAEQAYYYKAALWAKEQGLTAGERLNPDGQCTRGSAVTYLWKLAGSPRAQGGGFTDVPGGSAYAQAVAWAVSREITKGTSGNTFSPDSTCTRGQIVTFLYRDMK